MKKKKCKLSGGQMRKYGKLKEMMLKADLCWKDLEIMNGFGF